MSISEKTSDRERNDADNFMLVDKDDIKYECDNTILNVNEVELGSLIDVTWRKNSEEILVPCELDIPIHTPDDIEPSPSFNEATKSNTINEPLDLEVSFTSLLIINKDPPISDVKDDFILEKSLKEHSNEFCITNTSTYSHVEPNLSEFEHQPVPISETNENNMIENEVKENIEDVIEIEGLSKECEENLKVENQTNKEMLTNNGNVFSTTENDHEIIPDEPLEKEKEIYFKSNESDVIVISPENDANLPVSNDREKNDLGVGVLEIISDSDGQNKVALTEKENSEVKNEANEENICENHIDKPLETEKETKVTSNDTEEIAISSENDAEMSVYNDEEKIDFGVDVLEINCNNDAGNKFGQTEKFVDLEEVKFTNPVAKRSNDSDGNESSSKPSQATPSTFVASQTCLHLTPILQLLYSIPEFREKIITYHKSDEIANFDFNDQSNLMLNKRLFINELCMLYWEINSKRRLNRRQWNFDNFIEKTSDVYQCYRLILKDVLSVIESGNETKETANGMESSSIKSLFYSKVIYDINCDNCQHIHETKEKLICALPLHFEKNKEVTNLQKSLSMFFEKFPIKDRFKDVSCCDTPKIVGQYKLNRPADYCLLHFKLPANNRKALPSIEFSEEYVINVAGSGSAGYILKGLIRRADSKLFAVESLYDCWWRVDSARAVMLPQVDLTADSSVAILIKLVR